MTRAGLIAHLAERQPQLTKADVDMSVRLILEGLSNTLAKHGRVEIRGLGTFGINSRPARMGRNPKTGETVMVSAKDVPHFKPGKELRERVDY